MFNGEISAALGLNPLGTIASNEKGTSGKDTEKETSAEKGTGLSLGRIRIKDPRPQGLDLLFLESALGSPAVGSA